MDRKIEKQKWPAPKVAWYAVAALFGVVVVGKLLFGDHSSRLKVDAEHITISTVRRGPFQEYIPVTGTVIPLKTVYLDAVEGGRVEALYMEAGSLVKAGDSLLKLNNADMLLDVMYREAELFQQSNNLRNTRLAMEQNKLNLKAQLLELDYQLDLKERTYHDARQLFDKKLISEREFDQVRHEYEYLQGKLELTRQSQFQDSIFREAQIEQLEVSLQRMENNLALVKENLENLVVKAPVSGLLTSLNAEIGESKSRGQRLGQIDILDGFKVRVQVDEYYISRINPGQRGWFTLAKQDYGLVITKVYPEVREGRFEVDMEFAEAPPEGIRRGQSLHIRLELGDLSTALLLERGGFYQATGGQWVYVLDQSGKTAVKRSIKIGRQNPEVFEILEGLQAEEQVVISSYENFGDMDKLVLNQ
ncbi:MAG: HlyD family efflux transporter periplasmic adaptor subunit [Desulfurivibrio sp.]|nr:MAG: HlyD family efflux transporter periplasmic adaptor subunit [Desulfurivibrio sp.]